MFLLQKVSRIFEGIKSGDAPPAAALEMLGSADQSGVLSGLLESLGAAPEHVPAVPTTIVDGPMVVIDTNSSRKKIKIRSKARKESPPKSGVAILVDQRTGKRFVVQSEPMEPSPAHRAESALAGLPNIRLPEIDLSGAGDIRTRQRRAYALLAGTIAGMIMLLLVIRRRLKR